MTRVLESLSTLALGVAITTGSLGVAYLFESLALLGGLAFLLAVTDLVLTALRGSS